MTFPGVSAWSRRGIGVLLLLLVGLAAPDVLAAECTTIADCNDNNPCTDDLCNASGLCEYTENTLSCDDDNACTAGETCAAGACTGGVTGAGMTNTFANQTTQGWFAVTPPPGTTAIIGAGSGTEYALHVNGPKYAMIRKDKMLVDPINLTGQKGDFLALQNGASISVVTNQKVLTAKGVYLNMYVYGSTHKGRFIHYPFDGNGSTDDLGNGWFRLWFANHHVKSYDDVFGSEPPDVPYTTLQFSGFAPSDFRFNEIEFQGPGSCDDGNPCTFDGCAPNLGCHTSIAPLGTLCNDQLNTTWGDMCNAIGVCTGIPVKCDLGPCDLSAKPVGKEVCEYIDKAPGDSCDDYNSDTANDMCTTELECVGTLVVCETNTCIQESYTDGSTTCQYVYFPAGTVCNDDDPGTIDDKCQGGANEGICAGQAVDCYADLGDINEGCIDKPKTVVNTPKCDFSFLAGSPCDDGEDTTKNDVCASDGGCNGKEIFCDDEPPADSCFLKPEPDGTGCVVQHKLKGAPCDDSDPTTTEGTCDGAGACLPGTPIDCSLLGVCVGASEPNGVDCTDSPAAVGTPCVDEDPNTKNDVCDGTVGGCAGEPYTCEPAQCETSSTPDGTACHVTNAPKNSPCDDQSMETKDDYCNEQGLCTGTTIVCPPVTPCMETTKPNGVDCDINYMEVSSPCDDGDPNTGLDACDGAGGCAGTAIDCFADLGGLTEVCIDTATPNGTDCDFTFKTSPCDDDNLATGDDQCDEEGHCMGTTEIVCMPTDCQTSSIPNGVDCTVVAKDDKTPCDDGDATTDDTCQAGICVGTPKCEGIVCQASDQCHVPGTCEPSTGTCSNPTAEAMAPCDDSNACTTNDGCIQGICIGGPALDCDDANMCTVDSCAHDSGCIHTNNDDDCDDNMPCTWEDVCAEGVCAGTAYACSECETCDGAGECSINEDRCRIEDTCYTDLDPHPALECMTCDSANSPSEWTPTDQVPCNDNDPCTLNDECSEGLCGGDAVEPGCTTDQACQTRNTNPCVVPTCDVPSCTCVTDVAPFVEGACEDGNVCTENGVCDGGTCVSTPISCDDGNLCTTDTCNDSGCINLPNTDLCDDGDACTQDDVCGAGSCAGVPMTCAKGERCMEGACESMQCEPCSVNSDCGDNAVCLESDVGASCMILCDGIDDCGEGSTCEARPSGLSLCISEVCQPTTPDTVGSSASSGCALITGQSPRSSARLAGFLLAIGMLLGLGRIRQRTPSKATKS